MNTSWLSRATLCFSVGLAATLPSNLLPPKVSAWAAVCLAMLQAFQKPVQQSTGDNKVANQAIEDRATENEKGATQ